MGTEQQSNSRTTFLALLIPRILDLRRQVERRIPPRLRGSVSADDILQEIWVAACRYGDQFQPEGDNAVDRWLARIVVSKVADALRYSRRKKRCGGAVRQAERRLSSVTELFTRAAAHERTPCRESSLAETAQLLEVAIAALNDARRAVVLMHYRDGLTCSEIARKMGRSETAINDLLFRGRRQMHQALGSAVKYFTDVRTDDAESRAARDLKSRSTTH